MNQSWVMLENKKTLAFSKLNKQFQSYINFKRKHGIVLSDTVFVLDIVYITPTYCLGLGGSLDLKKWQEAAPPYGIVTLYVMYSMHTRVLSIRTPCCQVCRY